jgi:hypothetical protein
MLDWTGENHLKWSYPGSEWQKAEHSLWFVEYRPNTNVAILWNTGHTKGRSHTRELEKLRAWIGSIYLLYNDEYRNLKVTETTIKKGLRYNEEN